MTDFPKPILVVSKCITFEPVRWNGLIIASEFVEKLKPYVNFVPVCPEIEIGLSVPRDPLRIVLVNGERRLLQPSTGRDFTDKMNGFLESFLNSLKEVDGFILKSGSPSSGFRNVKIYSKMERSASVAKGPGFFGKAVLEKFPYHAIEDERRLLNHRIKEHFLRKLFTLAGFRESKKSGSTKRLVKFQSENKLLLTAYSQRELGILGRIVANQERKPYEEMVKSYEKHLFEALRRPPKLGSNINVLMKAMGYFSKSLTTEEKSFFLSSLNQHKAGRIPLSVSVGIMKSWIIRFKEPYLMMQTFFEPYPEELAETGVLGAEIQEKDYWK